MSATPDTRPEATELWHHLLYAFDEHSNVSTLHTLDEWRIIRQLQNLYWVGEHPSYEEMTSYLERLWPAWPSTRRKVREIWRTILRNPCHTFRRVKRGRMPLSLLASLIEEHDLLSLEERITGVLEAAQSKFLAVALSDPDPETYFSAHRDLRQAMAGVTELRELRLGFGATGNWIDSPDDQYSEAQASRWIELRKQYQFGR